MNLSFITWKPGQRAVLKSAMQFHDGVSICSHWTICKYTNIEIKVGACMLYEVNHLSQYINSKSIYVYKLSSRNKLCFFK